MQPLSAWELVKLWTVGLIRPEARTKWDLFILLLLVWVLFASPVIICFGLGVGGGCFFAYLPAQLTPPPSCAASSHVHAPAAHSRPCAHCIPGTWKAHMHARACARHCPHCPPGLNPYPALASGLPSIEPSRLFPAIRASACPAWPQTGGCRVPLPCLSAGWRARLPTAARPTCRPPPANPILCLPLPFRYPSFLDPRRAACCKATGSVSWRCAWTRPSASTSSSTSGGVAIVPLYHTLLYCNVLLLADARGRGHLLRHLPRLQVCHSMTVIVIVFACLRTHTNHHHTRPRAYLPCLPVRGQLPSWAGCCAHPLTRTPVVPDMPLRYTPLRYSPACTAAGRRTTTARGSW